MPRPKLAITLATELAKLPQNSRADLCQAWEDHLGAKPPDKISRDLLSCAIAYKMQEKVHGRLSAAMRAHMRGAVRDGRGLPPTPALKPGTVLLREWRGTTHEVTVLERGFLYRDKRYRSLTALAEVISGLHRSGPEFFGVRPRVQS